MEETEFDVLVIGAGAAGLIGALEIALTGRRVAVIEATNRIGGRIFTLQEDGVTVELGAEFIHGNLPITQQLLQKAGAAVYAIKGSIWQHSDEQWQKQEDFIDDYADLERKFRTVKNDKPVADFLREELADERYKKLRLSLVNYVEGYYAADTGKASTKALREELAKGDEEQYRIEGGYRLLVQYLEQQCREKGVPFFLLHPVLEVQWKRGAVIAVTEKGSFTGRKMLLTLPVGVLQTDSVAFVPSLPKIKEAVNRLGFGHVMKVVLQFDKPFWKEKVFTGGQDLSDAGFFFSDAEIPTWWTHEPMNDAILTGWLGGPKAESFQSLSTEEIESKVMFSLSRLFGLDRIHLKQMVQCVWHHNWSADPQFCGAYSYEVVGGGEVIQFLQQPVEQTLFFAGEGLHPGPQMGTVEGALQSGKEAAHRLVASFSL